MPGRFRSRSRTSARGPALSVLDCWGGRRDRWGVVGRIASNSLACSVRPENPYIQETDDAFSPNEVAYIQVVDMASTFSSLHQCKYRKIVPGQPVVDILLSIEWGTLTAEDHAACKADILARQRALNLCQ
jgi:hypothetical protein